MDIEKIRQEYNVKRVIRDSLPHCAAEIEILEEDELVQKYIRLKEHQQQYSYLQNQTDEDILSTIISNDSETLDDVYFCYGKNFMGHLKMQGGYYIEPYNATSIRRLHGIRVAKYRNLADPRDVIIMPSTEIEEFESTHQVIQYTTAVPDEEYYHLRMQMYEQKIEDQNPIKLVKEPKHE